MAKFNISDPNCLGAVYVQADDGPPVLTLYVRRLPRVGIQLMDEAGVCVSPRSARLGFSGRANAIGRDRRYTLVCDDDVSAETRAALTAAGYVNVVERW